MPITPYPDADGPRYVTERDAHPVASYHKAWAPAGIAVPAERTKRRANPIKALIRQILAEKKDRQS
jgi:hypothetical protein